MKKSELKQIIKEEIKKILKEDIQDDFAVVEELRKLLKVSEDEADNILSGFKDGADLSQKRNYWAAVKSGDYKKAAQIVKKEWR